MRFFISVIFFAVLIFGFSRYAILEEYDLTASQKHFTAIVRGLPGITSAQWKTPISLWAQVSSKAVGSPPNSAKAQQLADILAERGRTALRQPFCVHIYQGSANELARSCVY
ncbi:MAG TPA: hypothetical protein VFF49_11715 [Thermodesulfobacteriota bacterium]|nr:hypothetical protein [Thermodesulfobacteriota bacterium]